MGKLKTFIESQTIGLGDLGRRIDRMYHNQNFDNQIAGAHLADIDLTIPSVTKTGRITILQLKKSPIYMRLSDGTELNFTWDEYKKIQGKPSLGKTMTVIFQRHPKDVTNMNSKIEKVIVH